MYATQFWHTLYFWCNEQRIIVYRLPTILTTNILARDISAKIFHNRDISTHACFGPVGIPAHGHFVSVDISVQGLFDTGTFRHKDFLEMNVLTQGHYGTGAKISSAETSMVAKIPWAKMSSCRKVLVLKRPWRWNVHLPVQLQDRSILMLKCPGDEMSVPKCLLPKCQVRNGGKPCTYLLLMEPLQHHNHKMNMG